MRKRSDDTLLESQRLLEREHATRNKAQFERLEQSLGVNRCPQGLLAAPHLGLLPISGTQYDMMHVWFVNGVIQAQFALLLQVLSKNRIRLSDLHTSLTTWRHPKDAKNRAEGTIKLFDGRKVAKDLKLQASEFLTAYPLIRVFIMEKLREGILDEEGVSASHAWLNLCKVLDLLQQVSREEVVSPQELQNAIVKHVDSFQRAHTAAEWTPKFHFSCHFGELLARHKMLLSCWVHERKHR